MNPWLLMDALRLCREVERVCPPHGCHVALTGGLLYKDDPRKDCDLLFYRIRQVEEIDMTGLFTSLDGLGIKKVKGWGWCYKLEYQGMPIDAFFPESQEDPNATNEGRGY